MDSSESTEKKPTRRRTRRKADSKSDGVEAATLTTDVPDDFGDGIDVRDDAKSRSSKKAAPKKRRTRKKADEDDAPVESGSTRSGSDRDAAAESSESDHQAAETAQPTNSAGEQSSGESSGRPQREGSRDDGGRDDGNRRRRRRRRRGQGGQGGQGSGQGGQGGQYNNSQRGGGGGGGGRGRNQRGRNQRGGGGGGPVSDEVTGTIEGILELHPKGYGFLRDPKNDYGSKDSDAFVSSSVIEKYGLREGVIIRGDVGPGSRGQGPRLKVVETIDGRDPEAYAEIEHFDNLTPINPHEQVILERGKDPATMRVMDLLTPIGKGQRALIVAPPRSGKTMLLQDIAESVSENHPEIHLIVLLVDERPEEVTEMRRSVKGEVVASSLDKELESHIRVSQLVIERAKRLAEEGKDVFVLLDSITRLARAFNKWSNTGRTATGGLDIRALDIPKKLFGTARLFEEGGSLTVAGTALIETGSRMDDAIFQEFKGTGNMELVLSRELADRRIWPAIDIAQSGTRREEKILDPETLDGVTALRRALISLSPVQAMDDLVRNLRRFDTNADFLSRIKEIL
ncbi:transcription termination factor Rho [Stratiformator vulcanicus]|uniref:Transcription termination factor Rho n=1 Tax=Stratiformator vulcanicus TaxID=2527980 RepID=A0A517R6T5_9PLAN|nr:transcription termination factor Rho [Stratiformator vulcanicus]QDT39541.1 hypothetical protein Pan189_39490 [Stratiformator vulcanicus]